MQTALYYYKTFDDTKEVNKCSKSKKDRQKKKG